MPKFALGQTTITAGALAALSHEDVLSALSRHVVGDWGEVDAKDWDANERALREGGRRVSVYRSSRKFYVITEWDRSLTTVLLPEEYCEAQRLDYAGIRMAVIVQSLGGTNSGSIRLTQMMFPARLTTPRFACENAVSAIRGALT